MFTLESDLSIAPRAISDAVVGVAEDAALGGWEKDETLEAAHLDEAVVGALVELVTVALMWHINLVIAFATG